MSFNLPINIEPAGETAQLLIADRICPRCPPPREGRSQRTIELKHSGGGYHWHQCTRCQWVFLTPEPQQ